MEAYEVWRGVMYCVGVFVTCNVGGMALRVVTNRVSDLMKPRKDDSVKVANDMKTVISGFVKGLESMSASMGTVIIADTETVRRGGGQSFEDIQRQIRPEDSKATPTDVNE